MHTTEILNKIKDLFPEISIQDFEIITKGYENDILIINKSLIFRISKDGNKSYKKEIGFLSYLETRVNTRIPQVIFCSEDFKIMGYRIIPGEELTQEILHSFSQEEKELFARQIAEFFIAIHSISFDSEIKALDFQHYHKAIHMRERLEGFLKKEENPIILAFAEKLNQKWNDYRENPNDISLLHNDLFFKNIICHPHRKTLSGIIDFSDAIYGDFTLDFVALYFEDSDLTEKIMDIYESLTDRKICRDTVKLFTHTFALNELYFHDTYNKAIASRLIGI